MKDHSIVTNYLDFSLFSGKPKEHVHHLIYGRGMRNLADEDGLTIGLTLAEHEFIHKNPIAGDMSKMIGQLAWEKHYIVEKYGIPFADIEDEAKEAFRKRYGRSYL